MTQHAAMTQHKAVVEFVSREEVVRLTGILWGEPSN